MTAITFEAKAPVTEFIAPQENTKKEHSLFKGLRISTFQKGVNLIAPQLVNAALTAGFIFLGVITNNPWLIASTTISGAIQAASLGYAWHASKGYLDVITPTLWATLAQINAAYFGNILGGTSAVIKTFNAFTMTAITCTSVWDVQVSANLAKIRANLASSV